ncbi:pentatricopeptide repeat-containing protein At1g28690, mitochondrial [Rosa rugosa]|uniref:pentatricopeptide repeat-containing protein At1g28690, mitochondrial n=1 Tax=Rosa rugosa TaxID=74645 RepID=UPI002B415A9F|nr:pentatricopeptide repeat-containing protein At1g28690, mitochondrial [Rosa rugosa]
MKVRRLATIRPSTLLSSQHHKPPLPPNQVFPPTQSPAPHPDATLSSTLQSYINSDSPSPGQKIHAHILKSGFRPNNNVSIKLLILHLKCGSLKYARQMFDELPARTLSSYNYLISGNLKHGEVEESINLVRRLVLCGERPDGYTFSMILKASACNGNVPLPSSLGRMVHAQIIKSDVEADDVLYTALVASYVRNGRLGYARSVFDMMLEKNIVCSTSMISGYMSQGSVEDAEDIFRRTVEKDVVVFNAMIEGYSKSVGSAKKSLEVYIDMQRLNFQPNISTFASLIGACSALAAFEIGQQVQCQLMKTNLFMDIKMGSALLDMYSKCGRVEEARRIFDHMPQRNVFSWTSMIDGYGKNGYPNEALELFSVMQKEHQIKPNFVTFLSALSACGHAGLVDKGLDIFESMKKDYSIKPTMEHYACMVDLLGRAGRLHQAWEFAKGIPEKPNSGVWAALLSSSTVHGDIEMARIASDELFKLNPDSRPGAYVSFSNNLAAAGKWDSVSELREKMKARGISKDIGWSLVGTDGN